MNRVSHSGQSIANNIDYFSDTNVLIFLLYFSLKPSYIKGIEYFST